MNARAVHGLASCKEYFIFRNSGPCCTLQFSPRVDACWTPDRLHVSGSGADGIPIQGPRQVIMAKSPQTLIDGFERGTLSRKADACPYTQ